MKSYLCEQLSKFILNSYISEKCAFPDKILLISNVTGPLNLLCDLDLQGQAIGAVSFHASKEYINSHLNCNKNQAPKL